jgi:predicted nucleic acid-binding protein
VAEEGASRVREAVTTADVIASSALAFVEARAALARRRGRRELPPNDYRRIVHDFREDWRRYFKVRVSESMLITAGDLAEAYRLRAYDAIHLASALALEERFGERPTFACWDRALNEAAMREGLPLLRPD